MSKIPPASGYRSDSKAEENAWNSNVPSIAAAWLADDPRSRAWLETARKYLVNTYTVPDRQGDPLAKWVTTTTLFPSFICENHGFFHPSYQMVSGMSLGDSLLMAELAAPAIAAKLASFAEHNVQDTWNCLSQVLLDSGELCYPSGLDWSLHGYGQVSYYAWLSTHFNDPLARWAESRLALLLRRRQEINGDGRFTGDGVPDGFYTEAVKARRVAIALLHHRHGRYANGPVTPPAPFVSHIPDAKLVLHRSKHGFFSVSYGPRVMALAVPAAAAHPDAPYVVTPSVPSLLAHANQADLLDIVTSDNGFEVVLLLRFGAVSMEVVKVVSTGDALVVIASPAMLSPADCFPVSIENHALTGGSRAVSVGEGSSVVQSMSGMQVRSTEGWLCVDGRFGYIAGPLGAIRYQAASGYNRRGAAEDRIWFSPSQPRAARYALVIPDLTPESTQAIQSAIRWEDKEDFASLRFEAPHSGPNTVALPMSKESALSYRQVPVAHAKATSASPEHPPGLCIDGDITTYWVSRRGNAEPGNGPTPGAPERLDFVLPNDALLNRIFVFPRVRYGPKTVKIQLDGRTVFEGEMDSGPLDVILKTPVKAGNASLEVFSSHDPRFPEAPRNTQVAEVLFLAANVPGRSGKVLDLRSWSHDSKRINREVR